MSKPSADRAATARVLADIAAATRPVADARTAAAVERVLSSAAPSINGSGSGAGINVEAALAAAGDMTLTVPSHDVGCDCADDPKVQLPFSAGHSAEGLLRLHTSGHGAGCRCDWTPVIQAMLPWHVSPHLFREEMKR